MAHHPQMRGAEETRIARALLRCLFETVACGARVVRKSLRTLRVTALRGPDRAIEVTLRRTAFVCGGGGGGDSSSSGSGREEGDGGGGGRGRIIMCDGFTLTAMQRRIGRPRAAKRRVPRLVLHRCSTYDEVVVDGEEEDRC